MSDAQFSADGTIRFRKTDTGYATHDGRFTIEPWFNSTAMGRAARGKREWMITDTTGAPSLHRGRSSQPAYALWVARSTVTAVYRTEGVAA